MEKVLSDYEKDLIQMLRQEAKDVKDCFTRYSFEAIAFSSAILGIIARFQPDYPLFALTAYASIALLLTVARIGIYKYGTANRMYGYELHLFRTRWFPDSKGNGWKAEMRLIGWEEAMRAWRIVQVTVFGALYETRRFYPKRLKKEVRSKTGVYKWFALDDLVEPEAEYHPGTYLGTMNKILFGLAFISCVPLFFMAYQLSKNGFFCCIFLNGKLWYLIPILSVLGIVYFMVREQARRKILESGLLSIHSNAIVWQAVVVAHYRALANSDRFINYTQNLVHEANNLVENIYEIHKWVYDEKDWPHLKGPNSTNTKHQGAPNKKATH